MNAAELRATPCGFYKNKCLSWQDKSSKDYRHYCFCEQSLGHAGPHRCRCNREWKENRDLTPKAYDEYMGLEAHRMAF